MSKFQDLLAAAVARRLSNISISLESIARVGRNAIEPDILEELWRYSRALRKRSLEIWPRDLPEVPDYFEETGVDTGGPWPKL